MRQAGLKPKSHNSGIYWTRAFSSNKEENNQPEIGLASQIVFWIFLYPVVFFYTWIVSRISDKG